MEALLEFLLKNFEFLYLDSRYRITDSSTSGSATVNASLTLTGTIVRWQITNDRGQILFDVAPANVNAPKNWFRISIIRQYLDGYDERNVVSSPETANWIGNNLGRIEYIFSDSAAAESYKELTALEDANATTYWGAPKEE